MDNKQSLEDKPTTNAAAEEILSDEELDSVAGGGGTGSGSNSVAGGGNIWRGVWCGGTGSGDRATINMGFNTVDPSKNTTNYAGSTGPG